MITTRQTPDRKRAAPPVETAALGPTTEFERAVIDQLYEGVYFLDPARRIHFWNRGSERLTGFAASDIVGRFCHDNLLNHVDAAGQSLCRERCPIAATMQDGHGREADMFLRHKSGHRVQVRVRTTAVHDRHGDVIGGVQLFDDKTELSGASRELSHLRDLAMTDALTGVPNRRHFDMSLANRIAELAGYGRAFGLLIVEIDRFKQFNDTYGLGVGDVALRTVATTMLESSRAADDLARTGGEEFGITVADVDEAGLHAVAERFRSLVAKSRIRVDDLDLQVTVSLGGALARTGETAATIFGRAGAALYRAKEGGRNRVEVGA